MLKWLINIVKNMKEVVVVYFEELSRHLAIWLRKLWKIPFGIVGLRADIWIHNFTNKKVRVLTNRTRRSEYSIGHLW